ncbi:hypothetical protein [Streptomyces sp. IBSBF 2435]|uniref:hypothetical protein n=1 Tax=Streptomyces sp. IBSBF 2435 TaxID=2903531 RepID=UPI002FDBF2C0
MDTAADSERTSAVEGPVGCGPGSGSGSGSKGAAGASAEPSPSGPPVVSGATPVPAGLVFDDPLDRPSSDDTDRGWGDSPSGSADDDFTRFLSEKPPHHL